jgi:hypothetical protein
MPHNTLLASFFTKEQPLGELEAIEDISRDKQELFRTYFHNRNRPFSEIQQHPTMIVGRRGSGKTDALLCHRFMPQVIGEYDPIIYFEAGKSASLFQNILFKIHEQISADFPKPMPETIAPLWNYVFWVLIFIKLSREPADQNDGLQLIRQFTSEHRLPENEDDPYILSLLIITQLVSKHRSLAGTASDFGFFNSLPSLSLTKVSFNDAKQASIFWLKRRGKTAIVLLDSFEMLDVASEVGRLAISGLLRSVSRFHDPNTPVEIRCCIPAEAYFYITSLSSNVLKDFSRQMILHWSAIELMQIAAQRYSAFITIHYPSLISQMVEPFDLSTRKGAIGFWHKILPQSVRNLDPSIEEDAIPYILRARPEEA